MPSMREQRINFLVEGLKYPILPYAPKALYSSNPQEYFPSIYEEKKEYRKQLEAKHTIELDAEVTTVMSSLIDDYQRMQTEGEASLFFKLPENKADFKYWLNKEVLSLEEGTALLLGKNPAIVNWENLKDLPRKLNIPFKLYGKGAFEVLPFVKKFLKLASDLESAILAKKLNTYFTPFELASWANTKTYKLPHQLMKLLNPSNKRRQNSCPLPIQHADRAHTNDHLFVKNTVFMRLKTQIEAADKNYKAFLTQGRHFEKQEDLIKRIRSIFPKGHDLHVQDREALKVAQILAEAYH